MSKLMLSLAFIIVLISAQANASCTVRITDESGELGVQVTNLAKTELSKRGHLLTDERSAELHLDINTLNEEILVVIRNNSYERLAEVLKSDVSVLKARLAKKLVKKAIKQLPYCSNR